jgi:5-methyltetrahydropteroyltriglutamate--homocysteine methyltransferase
MRRSNERILTTHTGSLPRPDDLVAMLAAREEGQPVDARALRARIRDATVEVVAKQVRAEVDVVSDGEMGKSSYATYVKDRLDGFGGEGEPPRPADLAEFPAYAARLMSDPALRVLKAPVCVAPIRYRDLAAVEADVEAMQRALDHADVQEAFLTAASPGVISLFLQNRYYKTHWAYLEALAEAMRAEYEAIWRAGFVLQIDCPDLAMGRHVQFANASVDEFRRQALLHVEALNYAVANIPAERMRMHLCWGNYAGPHHRDVALRDIVDVVVRAKPAGISFVAANPRHEHEWEVWQEAHLPDDKVLIPGVVDSTTNFIEHPNLVAERLLRFVRIVGRDRVLAGTDCGFGTFAGLRTVDPEIAWAKLEALGEGARIATGRLRLARRDAAHVHA